MHRKKQNSTGSEQMSFYWSKWREVKKIYTNKGCGHRLENNWLLCSLCQYVMSCNMLTKILHSHCWSCILCVHRLYNILWVYVLGQSLWVIKFVTSMIFSPCNLYILKFWPLRMWKIKYEIKNILNSLSSFFSSSFFYNICIHLIIMLFVHNNIKNDILN